MTTPTGSVAFTASLPVDVLMKSAPAIITTWLARATFANVARSPVPRMTFIKAGPQASRNARISSYSASHRPASACARVITTSISSAPAAADADLGITVGAVCVYHAFVPIAVQALAGSGIPVAAVSTGFPAGLNPLPQRIESRGETGGDRGHRDTGAGERLDRDRHEGVVHTHRADRDAEIGVGGGGRGRDRRRDHAGARARGPVGGAVRRDTGVPRGLRPGLDEGHPWHR